MYPHLNARSGTVIATKIRTRAVGTFSTTSQTFHSAHGDDGGSRPFSSCFHKFLGFIIHDFHVAFALIHSFPTTDATTLSHYLPLSNPPISCERAVGTLSTGVRDISASPPSTLSQRPSTNLPAQFFPPSNRPRFKPPARKDISGTRRIPCRFHRACPG